MKLEKILKEDRRTKQLTYEYILPDYEGTLKRVMMTDAKVMPSESSLLGNEAVLSGAVLFSMLYQTVDDTLESLSFEVPYECSFHMESEADVHLDRVMLASFSCLPSGPRRVMAKAEIVGVLVDIQMCEAPTLQEEENLMTLCENRNYHTHLYSKKEEREYAEEIYSCEGEEPKVLYSNATIEVRESHPMKDGVSVSGVCHIRSLLKEGDQVVRPMDGEIPFEEFIPMGEVLGEKASLTVDATLLSFFLNTQKEEGVCHLIANPTICFFVSATKENTTPFVLDAYFTECDIRMEYENVKLQNEYPSIRHRQKLECRFPKSDGDPLPLQSVLFAKSEGGFVECTTDDGVVYLMLKLSHSILGTDASTRELGATEDEGEGEDNPPCSYVRQKGESTHAINITSPYSTPKCSHKISSFVILPPEVYEEEDAFLLLCEVSFVLTLYDEPVVRAVRSVERGAGEYEKERDAYFITFPDVGASLWDIAKENHSKISDLLALNPKIDCQGHSLNSPQTLHSIHSILLP